MRMWMTNPAIMCKQHLLGEHNEIHKHRHIFAKHHSIAGRVKAGNVQIDPLSMKARHDEIAKTFRNHNSPYEMPDLSHLPKEHREAKVDIENSIRELTSRCKECKKRHEKVN